MVLLWAGPARAATVGILESTRQSAALSEAVFRIKGELLAVGLDVEMQSRPARDSREWRATLERLSHERRLDAIVDVIGEKAPIVVEIWAFEPSLQAFAIWRVEPDPSAASTPSYLAIRAIEVIRSNLVERGLWAREPTSENGGPPKPLPPVPVVPSVPADRRERFGLEVGTALLTSWQAVGPALLPLARIDWAWSKALVVQATAAGWGTRPTVEGDAGSARVAQYYGVAGLRYGLGQGSRVRPFASMGLGFLRTSVEGRAEQPEQAHDVAQTSFLMEGSAGLVWLFSDSYFLTFAAHAHLAEPYVVIHIADTVAGTTGRPNATLSVTLGAWL